MSRTQSQGLEYFPVAVDFFSDSKVKILKARYGADGIAVYMYILCYIYREGYYTRVNDDFIFIISDDLHISSETVQQVMTFLLKRSMFNEQLFKSDAILTSDGIQERWQKAIAKRAQKTPIKVSEYWLLDEADTKPYIKVAHFADSSAKKTDSSAKNSLKLENYPQSKVKKSNKEKRLINQSKKEINQSIAAGTEVKNQNLSAAETENTPLSDFLKAYPAIEIDISSTAQLYGKDFELIAKKFSESGYLRDKTNSLSWICRNYTDIICDKYRSSTIREAKKSGEEYVPPRKTVVGYQAAPNFTGGER